MHDDKVTTPTISTLLLVPADGDPMGLLAEGPCRARPPVMRHPSAGWDHCERCGRSGVVAYGEYGLKPCPAGCEHGVLYRRALVLAREGKPVPEGCDRAARAAGIAPSALLGVTGLQGGVIWCALDGERLPRAITSLGTLIALDPAGRDVTDEVMRGR